MFSIFSGNPEDWWHEPPHGSWLLDFIEKAAPVVIIALFGAIAGFWAAIFIGNFLQWITVGAIVAPGTVFIVFYLREVWRDVTSAVRVWTARRADRNEKEKLTFGPPF